MTLQSSTITAAPQSVNLQGAKHRGVPFLYRRGWLAVCSLEIQVSLDTKRWGGNYSVYFLVFLHQRQGIPSSTSEAGESGCEVEE